MSTFRPVTWADVQAAGARPVSDAELEAMQKHRRHYIAGLISWRVRRHQWGDALALLNSTERHAFLGRWWLEGRMSVDELRETLREWWTATDLVSLGGWHEVNPMMFRAAAPVMDADLPPGDGFVIFRGQDATHPLGISWTLDPKRAEYFAFHDRAHARDQEPRIFRGYLRREDVLGYFTDRGEAEIICDPTAVRLDWESGGTA